MVYPSTMCIYCTCIHSVNDCRFYFLQDFYYYLNDGVYSSYLQFCTFYGFDISQLSLLKVSDL